MQIIWRRKIMKRKKAATYFFVMCLSMAMTLSGLSMAAASEITDGLKSVIDRTIDIVVDPKYQNDKKLRRVAMRKIIEPKFNYAEMGRRSLAKNWNDRTEEERKEFIRLFSKLLENSYASKIESYRDEKIIFTDEIIKGQYAMVKTKIERAHDKINVDYKLKKTGNDWLVYDFIIEGVSMVRNYRSQFTKIIRRDSYKTLLEKMTVKIAELNLDPDDDNL